MIDAANAALPYVIGAGLFIVVMTWLEDRGYL
jgi:hypothetical protein